MYVCFQSHDRVSLRLLIIVQEGANTNVAEVKELIIVQEGANTNVAEVKELIIVQERGQYECR